MDREFWQLISQIQTNWRTGLVLPLPIQKGEQYTDGCAAKVIKEISRKAIL